MVTIEEHCCIFRSTQCHPLHSCTLSGMTDLNAYDIVMGFIFSSQIELNFTKLTVPTSETTNIKG